MANYWNTIKNKFQKEDGIVSVGFSDIVGSGVAAVFWLYIASVMNPSDYGEIHYFGNSRNGSNYFDVRTSHALTVYSAKKEKSSLIIFWQ